MGQCVLRSTIRAFAAARLIHIVQGMAQVGHEAAGVVKITLHLGPFQGALLGEEGDALMIHGKVCCGPEPFTTLLFCATCTGSTAGT